MPDREVDWLHRSALVPRLLDPPMILSELIKIDGLGVEYHDRLRTENEPKPCHEPPPSKS